MVWDVLKLEPEERGKAKFHFKLLGLVTAAFGVAWVGGYAAREHFNSEMSSAQKAALQEADQKVLVLEKQILMRAAARDREMDDIKKDYRSGISRIEKKVDDLAVVIMDRLPAPAKRVSHVERKAQAHPN